MRCLSWLASLLPPLPRRHRLRIGPQAYLGVSCCLLQAFQHRIPRRILPIPPAHPLSDEFLIQVHPIGQEHLGNRSSNPVEEEQESCDDRRGAWFAMRDPVGGSGQGQSRRTAALMRQLVSHRAQQQWHIKGFLQGLPCSEEFRPIQDIRFLSCA